MEDKEKSSLLAKQIFSMQVEEFIKTTNAAAALMNKEASPAPALDVKPVDAEENSAPPSNSAFLFKIKPDLKPDHKPEPQPDQKLEPTDQ
jgi:hypothetical protein